MSPRAFLLLPVGLTFALLLPSVVDAGRFGDFRHDYLRPDQKDAPVEFYGSLVGDFTATEREGESGSGWKNRFGDRSRAALWLAGSPLAPHGFLTYFAEGWYDAGSDEFEAGQIRVDLVAHSALQIRFGRFWAPAGVEMRSAPPRVNRFLSRPPSWTGLAGGVGVLGELLDGRLNAFFAFQSDFAGALADSLDAIADSVRGEASEPAVSGRVGLSPRRGVEIGGSFAMEERDGGRGPARVLSADFSIDDGPLHVQAEAARMTRDGYSPLGEPERPDVTATLFYGRIAYRFVEDTARFDHIEAIAGASVRDPDADRSDDRESIFSGGLAVSPWYGVSFRAEYLAVREQTNEVDNDLFLAQVLLFW